MSCHQGSKDATPISLHSAIVGIRQPAGHGSDLDLIGSLSAPTFQGLDLFCFIESFPSEPCPVIAFAPILIGAQ